MDLADRLHGWEIERELGPTPRPDLRSPYRPRDTGRSRRPPGRLSIPVDD
jgi:hypothetical protein